MTQHNRPNASLSEARAAWLAEDFCQGFASYVGYTVSKVQWGEFETRLAIEARHAQQDGFVHAGVTGTMADHTMGYAAYTVIPEDCRILSVEYKINLIRPAVGQELICRARIIKPGRTMIPTEAELWVVNQAESKLVVKAMASMAVVPASKLQAK
jgi:uncharacterized protein (TIGR00369 family)